MTKGPTRIDETAAQRPLPASYRATDHGLVVLVPSRCVSGLHQLVAGRYRMYESGNVLHVVCQTCVELARTESTWLLATDGRPTCGAEFDDLRYTNHHTRPSLGEE